MKNSSTILDLKRAIQQKEGHDLESIRLIYAGKELTEDYETFEDYDIVAESKLHMVLRV